MTATATEIVPAYEPVWTEVGKGFDKPISLDKALRRAGLDWTVAKCPIYGPENQEILGRYGVRRDTDGEILGVVGKTWQPVQNRDGFQIVQDVIEQAGGSNVRIEATGDFDDGRTVWVLAGVDEELQIAGEKYASYMLFLNGHNGRRSVTCCMMTIRMVCLNQMGWGMDDGRIVRVRHTAKAGERIKEAHQILKLRNVHSEELARKGEWLVEHTMDEGEFNNFLETLMPVPEEQEGKPAETMMLNRRDKVRSVYFDAPNLEPIRGTTWGALQSVVEYCDHKREFQSPETQLKAIFGLTAQGLEQQAFDLAMAFASTN